MDLNSITVAEIEELKLLCAAYSTDLEPRDTPQECFAYAGGVLEAARMVKRLG